VESAIEAITFCELLNLLSISVTTITKSC